MTAQTPPIPQPILDRVARLNAAAAAKEAERRRGEEEAAMAYATACAKRLRDVLGDDLWPLAAKTPDDHSMRCRQGKVRIEFPGLPPILAVFGTHPIAITGFRVYCGSLNGIAARSFDDALDIAVTHAETAR